MSKTRVTRPQTDDLKWWSVLSSAAEGNGRREPSHGLSLSLPVVFFLGAWKKAGVVATSNGLSPSLCHTGSVTPQRERALRHGCSSRRREELARAIDPYFLCYCCRLSFFRPSVSLPPPKYTIEDYQIRSGPQQRTLELPPSIIPSFVPMFGRTSSHLNTFDCAPGAQPKGIPA